jgi:hypothetical protein
MLVLLQRGPFGSGWFQLVLAALAPYSLDSDLGLALRV